MNKYRIGIIGAGNAGLNFYENLKDLHSVKLKNRTRDIDVLNDSQIIILCVRDDQIEYAVNEIIENGIKPECLLHVSGCRSSEVLKPVGTQAYGSVHIPRPLNRSNIVDLRGSYLIFEGNDSANEIVKNIFGQIDMSIIRISTDMKASYHYNCSLAGNIPVYFLDMAVRNLSELDLPTDLLFKLFEESYENYLKFGKNHLTGPIIRDDSITIQDHLDSIGKPEERRMYEIISKYFVKKDHDK